MSKQITALIAAALALVAGPASAIERWQLNLSPGVTKLSHEIYGLHMTIFYICVAIGVVVFGAMFYAMFKFRKSKGAVAATWSHSTVAEIIWTVVPILILVIMAVPATRVLINMYDDGKPDLTVNVTGYQWLWEYEYQGQDVKFTSRLDRTSDQTRRLHSGKDPMTLPNYLRDVDRPLLLPNDTKIRFTFTADDVIHAWWVPDLGWKQDSIPGFVNENWTLIPKGVTGKFRGQCAELCGKDHGFMPIVIEVVDKAEFPGRLKALRLALNPAPEAAPAAAPIAPSIAPAATNPGNPVVAIAPVPAASATPAVALTSVNSR
jgi:cytochrome c oxidase subunit II